MTKADILAMTDKYEIMHALWEHRELWDAETEMHRVKVARQWVRDTFGCDPDDIHYEIMPKNWGGAGEGK